jgi:hypothetical protein
MNASYENIIIAGIYFLGGIYALLTGILALANMDIKLPGFYQFGVFMTKILRGEDEVTRFENNMKDRKKAIRYGIILTLIGLIMLAGAIFVLFVA